MSSPILNRFLAALPKECAHRLISASRQCDLPQRHPLFAQDGRPDALYLLQSGIASVVYTSAAGVSLELETIGSEGIVGWQFLLGAAPSLTDCYMQVAGTGYRVPLPLMEKEFRETPAFRARLMEFVQYESLQAQQITACNRMHQAEARYARWLLMVQDRIGGDTLPMTQEFLSVMLGTRRTTVAEISAELARDAIVETRRGGVRIRDRERLHERACECYDVLHALFNRLYESTQG